MNKTSQLYKESGSTVSDIVRSDYRTADVFKKHGINFCCSGNISLEAACSVRNIDSAKVVEELEEATRSICLPNSLRFTEWKIGFLADYIQHVHHDYLYHAMPSLDSSLQSFILGHKKKYPELEQMSDAFSKLSKILLAHIRHEDEIIFPYVRQIEAAHRRNEPYGNLLVRTLRKPIGNIEREHGQIAELLKMIKQTASDFHFPTNACTNHQVIYHRLEELHEDMIQHMHLENNILYPKLKEIEQRLLGQ